MCYLVGDFTYSILPKLKKQRRERNLIDRDACYHGKKPSLTPGQIQLQTCQCHGDVNTSVPQMGHMSQSTSWAKRPQTYESLCSLIAHMTLHHNNDSIKVNAVPICAVATPVLCNRIGNNSPICKASISSVTQPNCTNGMSGFGVKVDLSGAMSVRCDRIGNEVSVSSVTHPHHMNNARVICNGNERPLGEACNRIGNN